MIRDTDVQERWKQLEELVKNELNHPRLWQVLEEGTPLCIDDDSLVVGFEPQHVEAKAYASSQQASFELGPFMERVFGERLKLAVFDGTDFEKYLEFAKRRQDSLEDFQYLQQKKELSRQSTQTWEELWLALRKRYLALPDHTNETASRFLLEVIVPELDKMVRAQQAAGLNPETLSRNLNRITERLGNMIGTTGFLVALEYVRYKREKEAGEK